MRLPWVPQQERYAGYRVMSIDGSTLDVPDEQANAQAFGYPQGGRGEAAYPQIRFVALAECATHALCQVQMGGLSDSEQALTRQLFPGFSAVMLVLADRLFYGYEMWRAAVATGAKLLWRVKSNLRLPSEAPLPDGSFLRTVYASDSDRRHQRDWRPGGVTRSGAAAPPGRKSAGPGHCARRGTRRALPPALEDRRNVR